MMKLAEEHGKEAYIAKTPSFEYWDEMPSREKIDSMAEYLQDVSFPSQRQPNTHFSNKRNSHQTVYNSPQILTSKRLSIRRILHNHNRQRPPIHPISAPHPHFSRRILHPPETHTHHLRLLASLHQTRLQLYRQRRSHTPRSHRRKMLSDARPNLTHARTPDYEECYAPRQRL
jgi:hypothetical protein